MQNSSIMKKELYKHIDSKILAQELIANDAERNASKDISWLAYIKSDLICEDFNNETALRLYDDAIKILRLTHFSNCFWFREFGRNQIFNQLPIFCKENYMAN